MNNIEACFLLEEIEEAAIVKRAKLERKIMLCTQWIEDVDHELDRLANVRGYSANACLEVFEDDLSVAQRNLRSAKYELKSL